MPLLNRLNQSIVLSIALISTAQAVSSFPRGCEVSGFAYDKNSLVLNEQGNQSYYLIQNRTENTIELERYDTGETFMSPPLHASFDPMNWGAFASDIKNFNFKCYKHAEESAIPVDCRDVLEICRYPRVRFALSNMGNYWISTNKAQNAVIQDSVDKGIYLKW